MQLFAQPRERTVLSHISMTLPHFGPEWENDARALTVFARDIVPPTDYYNGLQAEEWGEFFRKVKTMCR